MRTGAPWSCVTGAFIICSATMTSGRRACSMVKLSVYVPSKERKRTALAVADGSARSSSSTAARHSKTHRAGTNRSRIETALRGASAASLLGRRRCKSPTCRPPRSRSAGNPLYYGSEQSRQLSTPRCSPAETTRPVRSGHEPRPVPTNGPMRPAGENRPRRRRRRGRFNQAQHRPTPHRLTDRLASSVSDSRMIGKVRS